MAGEIEFLPQDPSEDEPPPVAPPLRPAWHRRAGWGVAAAVISCALAAWIATRPAEPPQPQAAATTTVTPAATPAATASPRPPLGPAHEPALRTCHIGGPVSHQLSAIVRHYVPGIAFMAGDSYRCTVGIRDDKQVVSESVAGNYRGTVLEVQVSARMRNSALYVLMPPNTALVPLGSTEAQSAGLVVRIAAFGRRGTHVAIGQMSELGEDLCLNLVL